MSSAIEQLAPEESEFIFENAHRAVQRAESTSLVDVLRSIHHVHGKKDYGWEEAVLTRGWYRYPSEIGSQIFCSENALKNYLLIRALGIPAQYGVITIPERGLTHEVVLVPEDGKLWFVDWSDSPVVEAKLTGNKIFVPEGGGFSGEFELETIDEDEVIPRVESLRSGESFLDALVSGQMLYRRETGLGMLEGYVKLDQESQQLDFYFIYYPAGGVVPCYLKTSLIPKGGEIHLLEEAGAVLEGSGPAITRAHLWMILNGKDVGKDLSVQIDEKLLSLMGEQIIHHCYLGEKGTDYVHAKDIREKYLAAVKEKANDLDPAINHCPKAILEKYESMAKRNPRTAESFIDFMLTDMEYNSFSYRERMARMQEQLREPMPESIPVNFMLTTSLEMSQMIDIGNSLDVHRVLQGELSRRTGIAYEDKEIMGLDHLAVSQEAMKEWPAPTYS